jgi:hypothetical protein
MTPLEALAQLVDRCEHVPILKDNEGMRGPLLADARVCLKEHGIDSHIPPPGASYQGWITFQGAPLCIVAEERLQLMEAITLLLAENRK